MSFYELTCCNKLYAAALGYIDRNSVTKHEAKAALESLKRMAENRDDWTKGQREMYKNLIEFAKAALEVM